MTADLHLDCEWSNPAGFPSEVAETCAFIEMKIGEEWVTRCDSEFSGSVSNRALLSAYPLAMWLVSSWWRLRWETNQLMAQPTLDWQMSHSLPAAGGGFIWPAVTFQSDGESIEVTMYPSGRAIYEPLKYIGRFRSWIDPSEFESVVERFVRKVLSRLADRGLARTELHELWDELAAERADQASSEFRRLEAILGFDPGEARDDDIEKVLALRREAGSAAAEEIAYASSGVPQAAQVTAEMVERAGAHAPQGAFEIDQNALGVRSANQIRQPWDRGYALADKLRSHCGWADDVVTDEDLSLLLGVTPAALKNRKSRQAVLPFGLAVRASPGSNSARFVFRSATNVMRRFEAARMLADHLFAPTSDTWLPTTATHTARQKTQRAFAAELLCPNRELRKFVGQNESEYRLSDAAQHFKVGLETVKRQLSNHWQ